MAIVARFNVRNMTADKYDETLKRLEQAGAGAPPGRLYHISYGSPDNIQVIDVYESPEAMQSFGQTLGPILQGLGVEATPDVQPVHNLIQGT